MKKLATIIFIILIFLPMIIYLNPFTWGMRRMPKYRPSSDTTNLLLNLDKKYNLEMNVGEVIDTLWYFRDIKNNKISKLENFELNLTDDDKPINLDKVKDYVKDFSSEFEHKKYFDSIKVYAKYDSIIYKTKMK
ncbi:hypothetical protein [Epilithonimonas sp.]|uniref:hypothetical protein n=1 Tax=Epilithonimonas sp. TaxID=2894511 RepID=UPI0028B0F8C5|nr:hypothetical protein [Epilithonimonas sp.]